LKKNDFVQKNKFDYEVLEAKADILKIKIL